MKTDRKSKTTRRPLAVVGIALTTLLGGAAHAQTNRTQTTQTIQGQTRRTSGPNGSIVTVSGPLIARQTATLAALGPVFVSVSRLSPDIEAAGLHQKQLQADCVAALTKAGVPVSNNPKDGRLLISLVLRPKGGVQTVLVLTELVQPVFIARHSRPGTLMQTSLPTWQDFDFGVLTAAATGKPLQKMDATGASSLRKRVGQSVTLFAAAYKDANTAKKKR